MKEEVRVLIDEESVAKRVREIAEQINRDYEGKKLHMICMDFMSVSSYGDGLTSSGCITINQDLTMNIEGKEVLLVEDIVDSGRTLSYLAHMLQKRNPASLKICTLLEKPQCRVTEVEAAYTGFTIEDLFVVGYGLDYAQRYRNLPYIGELKIKED